jgi:stringent starvation protein A
MAIRRSVMTLFSGPSDPWSHRVRVVLAEKGLEPDVIDVVPGRIPEDLLDLNPYHSVPTLVDRDLVLYDSRVVIEYLDERFPHPPLMPVDPVSRARSRLALYRIEHDWYGLAAQLDAAPPRGEERERLRRILRDTVVQAAELFRLKRWFLSDEYSLADATLAPILLRLPAWGIELPLPQSQPLAQYANALFSRRAFHASLSAAEQDMRLN